jgi:hypothetical protein
MKRYALTTIVFLCCLAFAASAFAAGRDHNYKEFFFGEDYHKSPGGIHMNYMAIHWNDQGVQDISFHISSWKGQIDWMDMYFIGEKDGKKYVIYKLSDKKQMGQKFCYTGCPEKSYRDTMYFEPPVGPFDLKTGEVWWVYRHGANIFHVVWSMKDNSMEWYKAEDKEAPPVLK